MARNLSAAIFVALSATACGVVPPAPDAASYGYEETRDFKPPPPKYVDFAELEYSMPLTLEERAALMPAHLRGMSQEAIERIYARLTAGSIPDGAFEGEVFITTGTEGNFQVDDLLWGYLRRMLARKTLSFNAAVDRLWRGKVFVREQGVLRNRVVSLEFLRDLRLVEGDLPKAADGKEWELFPGKFHCGQSLLDSRRESVVIDYLFNDEIPGYQERPDLLPGRRGLQVRDEIRMVRPGFYLGGAYVNRIFLLTFTLYSKEIDERERADFTRAGPKREDCWVGTQARRPMPR